MPSGLIFITGATGFIGGATALAALQAGYRTRISVRKDEQIKKLKEIFACYISAVEFVIVPDITTDNAYSGKLEGVDYVFHLASPLYGSVAALKEHYFPPAKNGTLGILKEASKVLTVKKVAITSSIMGLIPAGGVPEGGVVRETNDWDLSVDETADYGSPEDPSTAAKLYKASKRLAHNVAWSFMRTEKPNFNLVTLHPSFVYGPDIIQTGPPTGTNGLFFHSLMTGSPFPSMVSVHVFDVTEAHLKVLDPDIKDELYLLTGPHYTSKDIVEIPKRDYPKAGWKLAEDTPGPDDPTDTSKAEKELGMKFRSIEDQIRDVMDQQMQSV